MKIQAQAEIFAIWLPSDGGEHISDIVDAKPHDPKKDTPDMWLSPGEVLRHADPDNETYPEGVEKHKQRIVDRGGIRHPISIVTNGSRAYVEDGHHRAMAAQQLGLKQVPVKVTPTEPDDSLSWAPPLRGPLKDWVHSQSSWGNA